jgi:murein DD-endopeptidase MepM/ murein hydrolase activator NlpD
MIVACAGCIVLGTIVGATLNSRTRATEQAVVQATAEAGPPQRPAPSGAMPAAETPAVAGTPTVAAESTATETVETRIRPAPTGATKIAESTEITTSQPPASPLEPARPVTPTQTTAAGLSAQPFEMPGPSQSLELTPTRPLTLSSVILIENVGQLPAGIRFQVRGATGGGIWLAPDAMWLLLLESGQGIDATQQPSPTTVPQARQGLWLKFSFVGANPTPELVPFGRLDTRASYFAGSDPAGWHTDVPVWSGVRYQNLYPGIDLELSGEGGQYVERLVVAPGADLSAVQMRVEGAQAVSLEPLPASGDEPAGPDPGLEPPISANATPLPDGSYYLRLTTTLGELSLPLLGVATSDGSPLPGVAPPSLATADGSQVITSPFLVRPPARVVPGDQRILPQSTTPVDSSVHLLYSAFLGRGGNDVNRALAVDPRGSAYVSGDTYLPTFPAQPGAFDAARGGTYDAFVVKINAAGSELAYIAFLGGSGDDGSSGIALDGAGSAYLAGQTASADWPVTAGAFDTQHHGGTDGFVAKLSVLGTDLSYATLLGGEGDDSPQGIAVDAAGNAYVVGATRSADFPTTTSAQGRSMAGGQDAFVVRVNGAGTRLDYSTFLGGSSDDQAAAVAVDGAGNAYVTGATSSADFPATAGTLASSLGGEADAFVAKVNGDGTSLAYVMLLGGSRADYGSAIAVDGAGNAYVTGASQSPDFPASPWAFGPSLAGDSDAFVAKVNPTGTGLGYAAFLGGSGDDQGAAIAVDQMGYVYVAGSAESFTLPGTIGAFDTSPNGEQDAFVVRVNELGTALEYATFVGGSGQDRALALAVDALGSTYVTGNSDSPDFAMEPGRWKASDKGYVPTRLAGVAGGFVFKLTTGTPFLDLPVSYTNFASAALGNVGDRGPGRVNSWFDHSYPNHTENNRLVRWDGITLGFSAASPSRIGESWYDGHGGIDFRREGWNEPIYAAAPGRVIDTVTTCQVGQTSCGAYFGNRVWIDHGNGYASVYAHLKSVNVTVGTVIADPAAQPLGIMGNTGRSLGTHLHFGLYYDRNADGQWTRDEVVDPFGWSGAGHDPWQAPSRYLWKYSLYARQVIGISEPTTATGGDTVLVSPSGWVTAAIPAVALDSPLAVELWDVPPTAEPNAQWHSTGLAFWLKTDSPNPTTTLAQPMTVSVAYQLKDLRHLDPSRLTLYAWDSARKTWSALPTAVDTTRQQATAQTTDFGRFDLHAPLLCPSDSNEPDDDRGAAQAIVPGGDAVTRVFDIQDDVDWFLVEAEAGKLYAARTGHLGEGVTTMLRVYDADSQTPLASSEATSDGSSYVQWQAPIDGSYYVQVRHAAGSAIGCQASYEFSARQLLAPEQIAIAGPAEGKLAITYTFTATLSPAGASQPITYVWQIDAQPPVTHTAGLSDTLALAWSQSGPHTIAVTATNVAGTASSTHPFTVYTTASAAFSASPLTGTAPLQVTFVNTSSGDYTTTTWDFGDGATSRSKNPTHTYETAGTYTVTLTISGPGGEDVETRAAFISVQPAHLPPGTGYRIYLPSVVRRH